MPLFDNSFAYMQELEGLIAAQLGLEDLHRGNQTIRDHRGWRLNEKWIEYAWIVLVSRSFVGEGVLFGIRFKAGKFREHDNAEELVLGLAGLWQKKLQYFHTESSSDTGDPIAGHSRRLDLMEGNKGITLDGVSYTLMLNGAGVNTFLTAYNPNTEAWKAWEEAVWKTGRGLAAGSGSEEAINLFK